jgi:hypothetical protein
LTAPTISSSNALDAALYAELWTSLASLLRSYTAVHGLHSSREALVTESTEKITVRSGKNSLSLTRNHATVIWTRDNGTMGTLELTAAGDLHGHSGEQALDLAAEAWARELMQEPQS